MAEVHAFKDAALKEFGNAHIPTKEELLGSVDSVKQQAAEAQARAKKLYEDMIADAPPPLTKLPDAKRMEAYIDELAQQAETMTPRAPGIVNALKPCLLTTIRIGMALHPWFTFLMKYAFVLWELLPKNLLLMLFGAALCYFGGAYTASIAAIEAFRTMGWERAYTDFAHLKRQAEKVQQQSEKDDEIDDDGDGVADVAQISSAELVRRKFYLTLETIDEPHRIQSAIANVWAACLAVLATLRIQFAATTAMALGTRTATLHSTAATALLLQPRREPLFSHTPPLSPLSLHRNRRHDQAPRHTHALLSHPIHPWPFSQALVHEPHRDVPNRHVHRTRVDLPDGHLRVLRVGARRQALRTGPLRHHC